MLSPPIRGNSPDKIHIAREGFCVPGSHGLAPGRHALRAWIHATRSACAESRENQHGPPSPRWLAANRRGVDWSSRTSSSETSAASEKSCPSSGYGRAPNCCIPGLGQGLGGREIAADRPVGLAARPGDLAWFPRATACARKVHASPYNRQRRRASAYATRPMAW